ncbi:glutaminase family protein [Bacteroides sp.]|uniref:glutaminase family protein n=1 Tax=Bacteroides sp. TaxID=29523 RepID=UPI00262533E7|nr:glutaminase family protein [Bacteroides sp.]MDD3038317.1 DUF1793 domain-containing protein [Bacteroides sp.]
MAKYLIYLLFIFSVVACTGSTKYSDETIKNELRAPSNPILSLHPQVRMWSCADKLTEKNISFTNGKTLPFTGFLRVDGIIYRFMGSRELPMQAIAPMAFDGERWEGKFTSLMPNKGWEQPDYDDKYWQVGEGAFGTKDKREVKTQWLSSDLWVRREVEVDPYLLEHRKIYLRYSHDDGLQLYINGKHLVSTKDGIGANLKIEVPDSILVTMKEGKALIAAHCENKMKSALLDFGLFAEEPGILIERIAPMGEWEGRYTTEQPEGNWAMMNFNDSAWTVGKAVFGTEGGQDVHTPWNTSKLWVRRKVTFDSLLIKNKQLCAHYSHNDAVGLYINGKEFVSTGFKAKSDVCTDIPDSIVETMRDGKAVIAARCENRGGSACADFGLYAEPKLAKQKSVDVQATQTHYTFECGDVELKLTFTAPYLLNDLEVLSRPVNYISYQAKALDGKEHNVAIYFELDPHKAFRAGQSTQMYEKDGLVLMKTGRENQELWVDKEKDAPGWGYLYLVAKNDVTYAQGDAAEMRAHFMKEGNLKETRKSDEKRYAAIAQDLEVGSELPQHLIVSFDGLCTMAYFGEDLQPYWNKDGAKGIEKLFDEAEKDYKEVMAKCYAFDRQMMIDAYSAGGKEYAELCALAYHQTVASFQVSETSDNELLYFTPLVGSIDEYYAASPLFLYYNSDVLKAMLNPFFYFSESGKWNKPFPAHNLGGYPFVNGPTKGADLPVEEAGNMLIMIAAMAKVEQDASYAEKHWETLSKWAGYLLENGTDTGDQINAGSFDGRCPHNANLSAKGILGVASYALLARMLNKQEESEKYATAAKEMAKKWEELAFNGDHYRLAFDQLDSWGQKYNLIWDQLLGLNVFPDKVIERETAFYATKLSAYGCPLDSGTNNVKAEWMVWIAALNKDSVQFRKFLLPLYQFMNETKTRVPMPDAYNVYDKGTLTKYWGRPVVGGYFIRLLEKKLNESK